VTWFALLESNTTGTGRRFAAAARARGLRPVVLTRDPDRYPYIADDTLESRVLDTSDPDQVSSACATLLRDGGLAGVTSSSEYFVAAAARAAHHFGLPGPDADAVAHCRDKSHQRRSLAAKGVPSPDFRVVTSVLEAVAATGVLGRPVVLKPVTGSGSAGVRLCASTAEVAEWAAYLLGTGVSRILVETAIRGPEFSVETFDAAVIAVVGKRLGPEPWFVETGHDVPAQIPPEQRDALGDTALRALTALGLGWGAVHTELRWSPSGPVVVEVNPRLAGGMIPAAVLAATGVDLVDAVVARASGGQLSAPAPAAKHAAVRFRLLTREGLVTAVRGGAHAAASPGVVAADALTVPGAVLTRTHSFRDRIACVVAEGTSSETAQCNAERAAQLFSIEIHAHEGDDDDKRSHADGRDRRTEVDRAR
jgi:S-sulfo-L-cysteine synthase (3-phospho-L-serine-dependent)